MKIETTFQSLFPNKECSFWRMDVIPFINIFHQEEHQPCHIHYTAITFGWLFWEFIILIEK